MKTRHALLAASAVRILTLASVGVVHTASRDNSAKHGCSVWKTRRPFVRC